ncbi:hypothetical protein HEP86_02775 [Streptomyces sp. RPA4-5]|uniref:hypothetical protein n=1 Tax=Streptomyces TaxID=1883 RepID=UPI00143E24BC|nr:MULTISPECIES: hypothetical protein [Streptomyces]MCX4637733.1 hypothetical protein [Streptomyces platensis]QIY53603.1 hypothetical protein HEP86_02775 [Streptomyces sp. RPA4-5]WJY36133.1 hypothetical protein QT196_01955 [Streptomyces sp. P9-2B-2]
MMQEAVTPGSAGLLPMWYTLPEGFHPIDVSGDAAARMDGNYDALAQICPSATQRQLITSVFSFEAALSKLAEDGLVHLSSFTLCTDDDLLLTGTCQISVADRPPGDPNLFARSVLDAHPDGGTSLQKGVIELPAGIAAVVVSDAVVPVPGAFFGVPTDGAAEVLSVSFQMAFPRTPQAVAVTLSTEELGAQEEFLELATVVAGGISFSAPQHPSTLAEENTAAAASPFG